MAANWEDFYAKNPAPLDLKKTEELFKQFIDRHTKNDKKVVLVTSGGTTIPLERNTVRYVDNFSAGTRGSVSTEWFLEHGYVVIFMHRTKSLEPFTRRFGNKNFLDMLETMQVDEKKYIVVSELYVKEVQETLTKYKETLKNGNLLKIPFTTLAEYLWLLRCACQALAPLEHKATLYLAAAVSDFYVPSNEMSIHKIPSTEPPTIALQLVPKILAPLVSLWVPKAFVISFKLETDESLLIVKARDALNKYKHNLVIANMLQSYKRQVIIVTMENQHTIALTDEQINDGDEIERYIVSEVVKRQKLFVEQALERR